MVLGLMRRRAVLSAAVVALTLGVTPVAPAHASGRDGNGCAGSGGGGTSGIRAMLACGLAPPSASRAQNSGSGVAQYPTLPLGSPCIPTQLVPPGVDDPVPSREYVSLTPAASGDPETNLVALATIASPLPIGSPTGPTTVTVPPLHVETAAQLNADAAAEAQAIAQQLDAYQQEQLDGAATVHAFQDASPALTIRRSR